MQKSRMKIANKAGMNHMVHDRATVNEVVHEMSKDSAYFKHALRQDAKVDSRIEALKTKLAGLTSERVSRLLTEVVDIERRLEEQAWTERMCVVLDMDMFFAAVEMRDNPSLRHVPMAVGGIGYAVTPSPPLPSLPLSLPHLALAKSGPPSVSLLVTCACVSLSMICYCT